MALHEAGHDRSASPLGFQLRQPTRARNSRKVIRTERRASAAHHGRPTRPPASSGISDQQEPAAPHRASPALGAPSARAASTGPDLPDRPPDTPSERASFQRLDIARTTHHARTQSSRSGALRGRFKNRDALHVMRHRKHVDGSMNRPLRALPCTPWRTLTGSKCATTPVKHLGSPSGRQE